MSGLEVIDDFFSEEDFSFIRETALNSSYVNHKNEDDGVTYYSVAAVDEGSVEMLLGELIKRGYRDLKVGTSFLRLSTLGTPLPHGAHTDKLMGDLTAIFYLSDKGGTSIVEHITGMKEHPKNQDEVDVWELDHKDATKWVIREFIEASSNRMFIFDSSLFHRQEPFEGYGSSVSDGRLVWVTFFKS